MSTVCLLLTVRLSVTVKSRVFCIFIAKNYTCGQKPGQGSLIDPGAEDVKGTRHAWGLKIEQTDEVS